MVLLVGLVSVTSRPCFAQDKQAEQAVDFSKQIQPLLAKRCFACHGPDEAEGGLRFTSQEDAFAEADSGEHAIVAGDVDASVLLARVTSQIEDEQMPPEGKRLSPEEVDLLKRWIQQGAKWQQHWAFKPMQNPEPPTVDDAQWNKNPIDKFVYSSVCFDHLGFGGGDASHAS